MDLSTVVVRFGLYLDLMALFGLAAFGLHALDGPERRSGAVLPFRRLLAGAALAGAILSVVGLLTLAASMAGVPLDAVDRASVGAVLWGTSAGTAWLVRMAALGLALAIVPVCRNRPVLTLPGAATAGGVSLGTLAWTGHGAMDEGAVGWLHLASDVLHLLAAGAWIGALLALVLMVSRRAGTVDREYLAVSHRTLAGFSATGTVVVAVIVVTGLVNSWLLVGPANLSRLPATLYGQLLIAKLALFAAMLGLATGNRFRFVPAFERAIVSGNHRAALYALRGSLAVETACSTVVLALVAWLGTLEPPISSV